MLMQTSSCSSLHSSAEQNMCHDKEEHQNNISESERRETGFNKDSRERRRGTLFFLPVLFFAKAEVSLFLEKFQCSSAEIEDKKKTERERGI